MADKALVKTVVEDPMDFTVIARDPAEMAKAQKSLILWAARKIQSEKELLTEAQEQYDIAVKNKWRASAWKRRVLLSEKTVNFYRKIKMALEAGYYIVPPFPIDLFAVRTDQKRPLEKRGSWEAGQQRGRLLPPGEGRYVSDAAEVWDRHLPGPEKDGKPTTVKESYARYFREVDFPFKLAKPEILNATAEAMAKKLFDRMGVLPATRGCGDPVVCGQIIKPGGNHYTEKAITFFVAWWLDTKDL